MFLLRNIMLYFILSTSTVVAARCLYSITIATTHYGRFTTLIDATSPPSDYLIVRDNISDVLLHYNLYKQNPKANAVYYNNCGVQTLYKEYEFNVCSSPWLVACCSRNVSKTLLIINCSILYTMYKSSINE